MRRIHGLVVIAAVLATSSAATADTLINSDFQTSAAGWTVGGPENLALNGAGQFGDSTPSSNLWSYNTTPLPTYMSLDMDYLASGVSTANPFTIGLHVWGDPINITSLPSGPLTDHYGYFLTITDSSSSDQVLEMLRRDSSGLESVGTVTLPIDGTISHHLRWTDCGCGRLSIYVDDLNIIALYVNDSTHENGSGRYIGRTGTYLGIGTPGTAAGWVDNVVVVGDRVYSPEPATVLLLLVCAAGLVRRR